MEKVQLTQSLKAEAKRQGFDVAGVTKAVSPAGFERFDQWIADRYHGEMEYLETRKEAYRSPESVMPETQSILMLAMNYNSQSRGAELPGTGKVSRYAWGVKDYHDFIHAKLKKICRYAESLDDAIKVRGVIDTAPLLEREFAQLAGVGWSAKNTMLINKQLGSWFFLAAVLLNVELEFDAPFTTTHCGTCTACIDACPTDAFVEPHKLDATRCISYLTIEHRSPIPIELRTKMDGWILGCDVCQDVCPWNNKSPITTHEVFQPAEDQNPLSLVELFDLDDDEFRGRFRKTPLWRPKRRGILRNAAIALGNRPSDQGFEALKKGVNDDESLVRGASAWAIGKHSTISSKWRFVLSERLDIEADEVVREEIELAMGNESK